jgi:hypothetical protein
MKSNTLRLFTISGLMLLGTILYSIFKSTFDSGDNFKLVGAIATIAFGLSVAGLIIGLGEIRKSKNTKNWIGLVGNLFVVGLFILISVLSFR